MQILYSSQKIFYIKRTLKIICSWRSFLGIINKRSKWFLCYWKLNNDLYNYVNYKSYCKHYYYILFLSYYNVLLIKYVCEKNSYWFNSIFNLVQNNLGWNIFWKVIQKKEYYFYFVICFNWFKCLFVYFNLE